MPPDDSVITGRDCIALLFYSTMFIYNIHVDIYSVSLPGLLLSGGYPGHLRVQALLSLQCSH